jgi:hypothetical protein
MVGGGQSSNSGQAENNSPLINRTMRLTKINKFLETEKGLRNLQRSERMLQAPSKKTIGSFISAFGCPTFQSLGRKQKLGY